MARRGGTFGHLVHDPGIDIKGNQADLGGVVYVGNHWPAGYALLNRRVDAARINERAAGRVDERSSGSTVTGPHLHNLADTAANAVLMTLDARLCVING